MLRGSVRAFWPWALLIGLAPQTGTVQPAAVAQPDDTVLSAPLLRRPVALALDADGKWLFVANRDAGTIATIDIRSRRVIAEARVGRRLSDLAVVGDRHVVVVDEEANDLILLERNGETVRAIRRLSVPPYPVSVVALTDGSRCYVASLWPRILTEIDLQKLLRGVGTPIVRTLALPLAPREQILVAGESKLVVADSFRGKLAVVDTASGQLETVREVPGHHMRGLAATPDGSHLLVAQQVLHQRATTSFEDIHWGNLITNNIQVLDLSVFTRSGADPLQGSRLLQLGDAENGAGDPAGLTTTRDGTMVVALSGVDEVALGREPGLRWQRLKVGRRPTAVTLSRDDRYAFVADTFSDSVSVVDVKAARMVADISLGRQPLLSEAQRGELLFHDAHLTHDHWFSCNSCHVDGHTPGLLNDNLTDGSFGTPKRILTLLGDRDTAPYAWNGSMPDLESQIRKSVATTMQGAKLSDAQVHDLAAYLRTLPPAPPPAEFEHRNAAKIERGRKIFVTQGCRDCHTPPTYTSSTTYDVGFADEAGNRYFNPPSLRGVGQAGPYFHDGRAASLEDVFVHYRHQLKNHLADADIQALIAFLRSV